MVDGTRGVSFNDTHPEMRLGEIFLMNFWPDNLDGDKHDPEQCSSNYERLSYKTKRQGEVAYTAHGKVIAHARPIFVQRVELAAVGIDPDKLW